MNRRIASVLVRLYPRSWRERYGAEFEALLETGRGDLQTIANVVLSALGERKLPRGGNMEQNRRPSLFQSWCARAPWAMFGIAPLLLLIAAYFAACFILWSGWRIFLPDTQTPFVRLDGGLSIVYFGMGRWLYFFAPVVIGWLVGLIAVRQRSRAVWPLAGLALIALTGGAARVQTFRPAGADGQVSLDFIFGNLAHALIIFTLTVVPYLILRLRKDRSLA
jgi:hypothetical protein